MTRFQKKLWIGLAVMAVLTPLGLWLPEKFGAGDAWGEWGADTLKEMLGYVPKGLERLSELWKAPLPDYSTGAESQGASGYLVYIASGLVGVAIAAAVFFIIKKTVLKNIKDE